MFIISGRSIKAYNANKHTHRRLRQGRQKRPLKVAASAKKKIGVATTQCWIEAKHFKKPMCRRSFHVYIYKSIYEYKILEPKIIRYSTHYITKKTYKNATLHTLCITVVKDPGFCNYILHTVQIWAEYPQSI